MLNWSQSDLAAYVGATKASILAFESRERWPVDLDLDLIRAVFEGSGVEFIADLGGAPGVRLQHLRMSLRSEMKCFLMR